MVLFALLYFGAVVGLAILAARIADWQSRTGRRRRRRTAPARSKTHRTASLKGGVHVLFLWLCLR
jgi:hypothetical protein